MKRSNIGLYAVFTCLLGALVVHAIPLNEVVNENCNNGPVFWCSNLSNARSCNAVRHCIQTVWEKHDVPVDYEPICQTCKNIVAEARDQLRSNETMEEIKEVFEGTCKVFIPIKAVLKECDKIVDNFVPDLVEALSSQMNPDQVCTVAGLCNNAPFKQLMFEATEAAFADKTTTFDIIEPVEHKKSEFTCNKCIKVADILMHKFNNTDYTEMFENTIRLCSKVSSYSDACANIVVDNFGALYSHLQEHLSTAGICHLSGVCTAQYHQHPEDRVENFDDIMIKDDMSCDFCAQLAKHLRDMLTANTTEEELKNVLLGVCDLTKGFKTECHSIVNQYFEEIYNALTQNFDPKGVCFLMGLCDRGVNMMEFEGDFRPLLPVLPPAKIEVKIRPKMNLGAHEPKFTQEELKNIMLPIDVLLGAPNRWQLVENGEKCTICEYILHFVEETLATPATEDEIKKTVNEICNKMPTSLKGHCHDFVDMYGDAAISLLIQGLNPREVCPMLKMCPDNGELSFDSEVFSPFIVKSNDHTDKPTCPLCIFAVDQAKAKIQDKKTKENIQNTLNNLCNNLKEKLKSECLDFVHTYTSELIDMLIADFSTNEICVDLHLCPKDDNYLISMKIVTDKSSSEEDFDSNEIHGDDIDDVKSIDVVEQDLMLKSFECSMCADIIKHVEKVLAKFSSDVAITHELEKMCAKLPYEKKHCKSVVDRLSASITDLIKNKRTPKMVCKIMTFCSWTDNHLEATDSLKYETIDTSKHFDVEVQNEIAVINPPNCVLCEFVMSKLEKDLKNKTTQDEIKHTVENICKVMPKTVSRNCVKFIDQYANTIILLIGTVPPKEICRRMQICASLEDIVLTDDVIECGVCYGACTALKPSLQGKLDVNLLVELGCNNLPAKYYQTCSDMLSVYGLSLLQISQNGEFAPEKACRTIGKCFANEKSGLSFARLLV